MFLTLRSKKKLEENITFYFISPYVPSWMRLASKELAVGSIGYALNHAAHLLRLSTVDGARGGESCEPLTALPICADFVGRVPLDPKEAVSVMPRKYCPRPARSFSHVIIVT